MSEVHLDTIRKPIETKTGVKFWGYKTRRELGGENIKDSLTGLLNRKGWDQKVSEYSKLAARMGENATIVAIDLDELKVINDSQGHEAGDIVLRKFADVMRAVSRSSDILARYGGDEFAFFYPQPRLRQLKILNTGF